MLHKNLVDGQRKELEQLASGLAALDIPVVESAAAALTPVQRSEMFRYFRNVLQVVIQNQHILLEDLRASDDAPAGDSKPDPAEDGGPASDSSEVSPSAGGNGGETP